MTFANFLKMQDPLRSLPGYALRRASAAMMARLTLRLEPLGVRYVEASILMVIAENPGISQSALSRMLDIKRANMTPLAARLEERGFIERSQSDGRTFGLCLTAQGSALAKDIFAAARAHEDDLLGLVPVAHRDHLVPALQALWGEGKA